MSGDRYRISDQHEPYFVTLTVIEWIDVFTRKDYKLLITNSLNYCIAEKGLEVFAWVLMSNHLHMVLRARDGFVLSHILRDFKKYTSKQIVSLIHEVGESRRDWLLDKFSFEARRTKRAKYFKVWQDGNHAVCLVNNEMISQRINYIHQNPVRQMTVINPEDYLFSSAVDYSDGKGLVDLVRL